MSENILEHTTSITGLTCKPLSILSETISPQEMSRTRGGNGGGRPHNVDTRFDPGSSTSGLAGSVAPGSGEVGDCEIGCFKYCCNGGQDDDPQNLAFPTYGGGSSGGGGGGGGDVLGPFGGGGGGGSSSDSDTTNDDEGHLGDFWDLDFLDDGTEDECTVPLDCGDDEEEEDTEVYDP